LPAALTLRFEEADRVLEVVRIDGATERLDRLERNAVAGIDVSHLAFTDDDERFLMNAVLPRIQSEVNTAAQKASLITGFAVARDDLSFTERPLAAPDFFDHANLRVRDVNNSEQTRQAEQQNYNCDSPTPNTHGASGSERARIFIFVIPF
jgi:hypothetical protein